jgi:hypothetical protein
MPGCPAAIIELRRDVVPLFDLAQDQWLGKRLAGQAVKNLADVIRPDTVQHDEGLAGMPHVDQRLLGAETKAPCLHQLYVEPALVDGVGEGMVDTLRPVAGSACAHADGNARSHRQQLGQAGIANRVEHARVADGRHVEGSR